jgi:hypothetical protein
VNGNGPVFISYRQSDGIKIVDSLQALLRAAGLVVWRDKTDLPFGNTPDRLEECLTNGLSGAVLVVTPHIADSEIVRECELPRLLDLDQDPAFCLAIANKIKSTRHPSKCDYGAPDRLLRLVPKKTLANKMQTSVLQRSGQVEIARKLVAHRIEQRRDAIGRRGYFAIRIQTRPPAAAADAGEEDLHIRVDAAKWGPLPSQSGLRNLQTTLPLVSNAAHAAQADTVRVSGGAHLSIALALGAALPETKFGAVEVLDQRGELWSSALSDDSPTRGISLKRVTLDPEKAAAESRRVAVFVSLSPNPDYAPFQRLLGESPEGFAAAVAVSLTAEGWVLPGEAPRLSRAVGQAIKKAASDTNCREVHLAFQGSFPMAVLIGRYLNMLQTVAYEYDGSDPAATVYVPALLLDPRFPNGPIRSVLLNQ